MNKFPFGFHASLSITLTGRSLCNPNMIDKSRGWRVLLDCVRVSRIITRYISIFQLISGRMLQDKEGFQRLLHGDKASRQTIAVLGTVTRILEF